MIPVLLLALSLPPASAVPQGGGFDGALELVARGRYAEAIEAAAQDPDPLRRRQANVHARHHAGDLQGALAEARTGLREHPGEPWLLEQAAFLAVSLNEGRLALELSDELLRVGASGDPASNQRAAELHREAGASQARWTARRSALQRAQAVAGIGLILTLLALAWLARPTPPPPRAEARTP